MSERTPELKAFVDACAAAYLHLAAPSEGQRSAREIFKLAADRPAASVDASAGSGTRLPACEFLDEALGADFDEPLLTRLTQSFRSVEPLLTWRRRPTYDKATASENFVDGHANAMVLGPGGIEDRSDIWIGATILAPNVRYPDHNHAPEEVYLVLTEGEFLQDGRGWFAPGIGGSFYNVPHIRHAMRSGSRPLFALWALQAPTAS